MANTSDIQPDAIRGETRAQSLPVWSSAFRTCSYPPDAADSQHQRPGGFAFEPDSTYQNIEALFGGNID